MPDGSRPLAGIRVVEIAQNLAGPYASEILARLGADVLKIERPEGGDDARGWGPPFLDGAGSTFHAVNAGKRSVALDLGDPAAVARLRQALRGADVLVQNLRAGWLERLGLGADAVRALNPRIVYCSLSAFGPTGPLRQRPGYEPMMQAFSGLMLTGGRDGDPPGRVGVPILDCGTGMWAALGVMAGLLQRERTGTGCVVDASLFETALAWLGGHFASFRLSGQVPERHPTGSGKLIPFQAFDTKTGPLIVAAGNDRLFAAFARALEHPEWAADPRYATNAGRHAHREELVSAIADVMGTRTKGEWLDRLEQAGVPCAPVQALTEVVDHPQTVATGIVQPVPGGDLTLIGLPLRFDGARPPIPGPAPRLGEHADALDHA
jgi:crotonobetainyl-CoA:carnitine CoA-transferase CaiB-like acyl-CoA transferase